MSITIESSKKWKTAIADSSNEKTTLRGYLLMDLVGSVSFGEAIFLTLKGELPNEKEKKMLDALLVASIDHGIAVPSAQATRLVVSGGSSLNAAVAGGLLTLGDYHGGAIEGAAKLLFEADSAKQTAKQVVAAALKENKRLPGYGHKIYTTDPRSEKLSELAKKYGFLGKYLTLAREIEKELEAQKGQRLCLNVDGCTAAIILEMGFDWRLAKGFFIISRTVGLTAHAFEEISREKPFRRLDENEYAYDGPKERKLSR